MIRVRFHGHPHEGIRLANRLLGLVAARVGYSIPRTGSPDHPGNKMDLAYSVLRPASDLSEPAIDKHDLEMPDIIVVSDPTLLGNQEADVLRGQEATSALVVNSSEDPQLALRFGVIPRVCCVDLARHRQRFRAIRSEDVIGTGLAAAVARLIPSIHAPDLETAIRDLYFQARLPTTLIDAQAAFARSIFEATSPVSLCRPPSVDARYRSSLAPAAPDGRIETAPVEASLHDGQDVGDEVAVIDYDTCVRCGVCYIACADAAISTNTQGFPVVDQSMCTGCQACEQVCPARSIEMSRRP